MISIRIHFLYLVGREVRIFDLGLMSIKKGELYQMYSEKR